MISSAVEGGKKGLDDFMIDRKVDQSSLGPELRIDINRVRCTSKGPTSKIMYVCMYVQICSPWKWESPGGRYWDVSSRRILEPRWSLCVFNRSSKISSILPAQWHLVEYLHYDIAVTQLPSPPHPRCVKWLSSPPWAGWLAGDDGSYGLPHLEDARLGQVWITEESPLKQNHNNVELSGVSWKGGRWLTCLLYR